MNEASIVLLVFGLLFLVLIGPCLLLKWNHRNTLKQPPRARSDKPEVSEEILPWSHLERREGGTATPIGTPQSVQRASSIVQPIARQESLSHVVPPTTDSALVTPPDGVNLTAEQTNHFPQHNESLGRRLDMSDTVSSLPNHPAAPVQVPVSATSAGQSGANRVATNPLRLSTEPTPAVGHGNPSDAFNMAQSTARISAPMNLRSSETTRITAMMQQIDTMWRAIARLRQAHLERIRVSASFDQRSEFSSSLPDYASMDSDDRLEDGGRSTPRPHA